MSAATPRSAAELRLINRNRVYQYLYSVKTPLTKPELAQVLSMSLPTLTQNLNTLLEQGLIENSRFADSTGGRKARLISIVPQARYAVGVELSSRHIQIVAVDLSVNTLAFQTIKHTFSLDKQYAAELADSIDRFLAEHKLDTERLLGVGITVPGIVDSERQIIINAPTLNIRHADAKCFTECIRYPTKLLNDANAGGFAEWWDRTEDKAMAYLSLGRGIGGAILVSGTAYQGNNARSGEFGHMCIHPEGRECSCGCRGCLEAYCSTARLSDDMGISLQQFFDGLESQNWEYRKIWDAYLGDLVVGIRNINAILDCGVVLGGKLSPFLEKHFAVIEERLGKIDPNYLDAPYLAVSRHPVPASGIGAALCFVQEFIEQV